MFFTSRLTSGIEAIRNSMRLILALRIALVRMVRKKAEIRIILQRAATCMSATQERALTKLSVYKTKLRSVNPSDFSPFCQTGHATLCPDAPRFHRSAKISSAKISSARN